MRLPRHLRTTRDQYALDRWPTNRLCQRDRYFAACERATEDLRALGSDEDDTPHEEVVKMLAIFTQKDEGLATFVRDHAEGALDLGDEDEWAQIDITAAWVIYLAYLRDKESREQQS